MKKKLFYFFMAVVFIHGSVIYPYYTLTSGYAQGLVRPSNATQTTTAVSRNRIASQPVKIAPPLTPSKSIALSRTAKSVKVLWNPKAFTNSTYLEIVRTPPFPDGSKIVSAKNSSYIDEDVVDGEEYSYSVSMVDAQGRKSPVKTMTARFGSRTGVAAFGKASRVEFDGFKLNFKGREFKKDKSIRVRISPNTVDEETMLQASELFEVTLPDSEQPLEPVVADISYNTINMPKGYSENDLKVFIRHDAATPWEIAKIVSIDKSEKIIHAEIPHFSEIVAGFVSAPEASETRANVNTALPKTTIQSPFSGGLSLNSPEPNISGSLNQSIDIKIPQGRGGLTPSVGLYYSSDQGDGLCGIGWDLSSDAIVRDTSKGIPSYTVNDKFLYNGAELTNDAPNSTASLRQYRLKNESSFVKFEYDTVAQVWYIIKDGLVTTYGKPNSDDCNILGQSVANTPVPGIYKWMLYKKELGTSLSMIYTYQDENGNKLLQNIKYSDNRFRIDFSYENRPDTISYNNAGTKRDLTKRLQKIDIMQDLNLTSTFNRVKEYVLSYGLNDTGDSRLVKVELKHADLSLLSQIDLTYKAGTTSFATPQTWNVSSPIPETPDRYTWIDLNGDGLVDILVPMDGIDLSNGKFKYYKNNGNGFDNGIYIDLKDGTVSKATIPMERISFKDFNGDGKVDIVADLTDYDGTSGPNYSVFTNNGTAFTKNAAYSFTPSPIIDPSRINIMDMNGDGKPDWVVCKTALDGVTGLVWDLYLNSGRGISSTPTTWQYAASTVDPQMIMLQDLNGDGKQDLVIRNVGDTADTWSVYYNNGSSFLTSSKIFNVPKVDETRLSLQDMNGDGLPDLVVANKGLDNGDGKWDVYYNVRDNFSTTAITWNGPDVDPATIQWADVDGNGRSDLQVITKDPSTGTILINTWLNNRNSFIDSGIVDYGISEDWKLWPGDINGDGVADNTLANSDGTFTVSAGNPNRGNLLNEMICDKLDMIFDYENANNGLGNGRTTLKSYTVKNELDSTDPNYLSKTFTFTYEEGKVDRVDEAYYGFGKISTADPMGNKNVIYYDQTEKPRIGRIIKTEEYVGTPSKLAARTVNSLMTVNVNDGLSKMVLLRNTLQSTFNPDTQDELTTKTEYEYYGVDNTTGLINIATSSKYYLVCRQINRQMITSKGIACDDPDDDIVQQYEYTTEQTTGNITPKVANSTSRFITDKSGEFSKINETKYYFDGQSYGNIGTHGQLTKKEEWNGYEPSTTTDRYLTTINTYNTGDWTLLDSSTKLAGKSAECTLRYTYDPTGRFVEQTIKDWTDESIADETTQAFYDGVWGFPIRTVDVNGKESRFRYDNRERLIASYGPLDLFNGAVTTVDLNSMIDMPSSIYVYGESGNTFSSKSYKRKFHQDISLVSGDQKYIQAIAFFDGFGRTLQSKIRHQYTANDSAAYYVVSGKMVYDALGRVVEANDPVTSSSTFETYLPYGAGQNNPVTTTYDILGRVTSTTKSDGTHSAIETTTYYGPENIGSKYGIFRTVHQDAEGNYKESQKDARGLVTKVIDYINENPIPANVYTTIDYTYDRKGNLKSTKDIANNVIQMSYDELNRKISMTDPDMGTWQYTYNEFGQLYQTTDAKAQVQTMVYDAAGRLVQKSWTGGLTPSVSYEYGEDADQNNRGRLVTVSDGSGSESYTYNANGESIGITRSIDGISYLSASSHDALGRITELIYPHPASALSSSIIRLKYSYQNFSGLLDKIEKISAADGTVETSYLDSITYDAKGRRGVVTLHNGVTTTYTYDSFKGLLQNCTIVASDLTKNTTYSFDNMGNLLSKNDLDQSLTQYEYDNLYRLTKMTFSVSESGISGFTHFYAYDALGNILKKDSNSSGTVGNRGYAYYVGQPHAVQNFTAPYQYGTPSQIDPNAGYQFAYDANGSMTQEQISYNDGASKVITKAFTWNAANQLSSLDWKGVTHTYQYDYSGERIKSMKTDGSFTRYINGMLQIKDDGTEVYPIFDGVNRIASLKRVGTGVPDVYYTHTDHVGSTVLVTTSSGAVYQRLFYKGFGEVYRSWKTGEGWKDPTETTFSEIGNYAFTGQEVDIETGLYYYGARYYDPLIGRFISADTKIDGGGYDTQGYNRYSYCRNNPIVYSDPSGHGWWSDFWNSTGGKITAIVLGTAAAVAVTILTCGVGALIAGTSLAGTSFLAVATAGTYSAAIIGAAIGGVIGGAATMYLGGNASQIFTGAFGLGLAGGVVGLGIGGGSLTSGLGISMIASGAMGSVLFGRAINQSVSVDVYRKTVDLNPSPAQPTPGNGNRNGRNNNSQNGSDNSTWSSYPGDMEDAMQEGLKDVDWMNRSVNENMKVNDPNASLQNNTVDIKADVRNRLNQNTQFQGMDSESQAKTVDAVIAQEQANPDFKYDPKSTSPLFTQVPVETLPPAYGNALMIGIGVSMTGPLLYAASPYVAAAAVAGDNMVKGAVIGGMMQMQKALWSDNGQRVGEICSCVSRLTVGTYNYYKNVPEVMQMKNIPIFSDAISRVRFVIKGY